MNLSLDSLIQRLEQTRLVPVVVLPAPEPALGLAEALLRAGLDIIEVTFRTSAAEASIRAIAQRFPEMLVGAGTLLTPEQVDRAAQAGASFGVSPGFNPRVVAHAKSVDLPFIPGIATPSELEAAMEVGCKALKFFPAQAAGGVPMLKGMAAAYGHTGVRFMPTGGVDPRNLPTWLEVPEVLAVGGTWFVEKSLLQACDWPEVERRTAAALAMVRAHDSRNA